MSHNCLPLARKTLHTTTRHDPQQSDRVPKSSCARAAGSEGAAQKSVLHRDQQLPVTTARIDPAITGLRCPARSARSGDVRGDSRPLDRADPAATACDHVLTAGMPLERAGCRPASVPPVPRAIFCHLTDSHTPTNHATQPNDTTPTLEPSGSSCDDLRRRLDCWDDPRAS